MVSFLNEYQGVTIVSWQDSFVEITDSDAFDAIDLNHLREKSLEEIYQDFTAFVEPNLINFDWEAILSVLPKISCGVYTVETIIPEIVLGNHIGARLFLKNTYVSLFGQDTIQSVLGFIRANLNASKAAKSMYMHRNTLNYRLDHFTALSGIDVRTFRGAFAIFLLFYS